MRLHRQEFDGLLDFARQTRPQKQSPSLNQVVEDILGLVRHQASFRNLTIPTDLDPHLPADNGWRRSDAPGLGLAIAYGIMEPHKGGLTVDRAPGKGTTVSITLPIEHMDDDVSSHRNT